MIQNHLLPAARAGNWLLNWRAQTITSEIFCHATPVGYSSHTLVRVLVDPAFFAFADDAPSGTCVPYNLRCPGTEPEGEETDGSDTLKLAR
jgi:hypothetical protein